MATDQPLLSPADLEAIEERAHEQDSGARLSAGSHPLTVRPQVCGDALRLVAEVRRQAEEIDHLRYLQSRALSAAKAAAGHITEHRHSKTGSKEEFAACSIDEVVEILSHD